MSEINKMELAEWTMEQILKAGADQAAVKINKSREIEFSYRDKQLEKLQESVQNGLTIEVYAEQRYSSHSTNDMRKESILKLISEAVTSTRYLSPDEFRSLPDPQYYPKGKGPDLQIRDTGYELVNSDDRKKYAAEIELAALAVSDKIISVSAGYSDVYAESVMLNSNGFAGNEAGTRFSASAEVTVRDGDTGRPEDWSYATTRFHADLPSAQMLGELAANKALAKIGQTKIASGLYDMVIENRAGTRLIGMLTDPMDGRALQQKSSYLDGMLDKQIASEALTIYDDPGLPKGLGSRHFDGEGLAVEKRALIENGVLRSYFIDNYYGKKLAMSPNSGSTSNLIFAGGSHSLDQLIKMVDKGILVTGFLGGNSNDTTGDFSYGIVGMLIEKGKTVKPLNEMNISGNSKDFWNKLAEVGNDPYAYSSRMMPSLYFRDIQFSGI